MATDPLKSEIMSDERFAEICTMLTIQRAIDRTGISPTGRTTGMNGSSRVGKVERPPLSQTEAYQYADKLNMVVVQEAFSGAKPVEIPISNEPPRDSTPAVEPLGDNTRLVSARR